MSYRHGSVSLLTLLALWLPASAEPQKDGPYLVNDFAFAQQEARKSGKPIFVVFRCEV